MQHAISPRSRTNLTRGTRIFETENASFANIIQSSRWAGQRRHDEIHVTGFGEFAGKRWLGWALEGGWLSDVSTTN